MPAVRDLLNLNINTLGAVDAARAPSRVSRSGARFGPAVMGAAAVMQPTTRINVAPAPALSNLKEFTLQAELTPADLKSTQVILESESPPVRLSMARGGKVIAELHTEEGWQRLESTISLKAGQRSEIRLTRNKRGALNLEIDGVKAGSLDRTAKLAPVGRGGLTVGATRAGERGFVGSIANIRIRDAAINTRGELTETRKNAQLEARVGGLYGLRVTMVTDVGSVDQRFNDIKGIMHAAGVQNLDELTTLRIDQRTVLSPGTILRAPRAQTVAITAIDWSALAKGFVAEAGSQPANAKRMLDATLMNRSSASAAMSPGGGAPARPSAGGGVRHGEAPFLRVRPGLNADLSVMRRGPVMATTAGTGVAARTQPQGASGAAPAILSSVETVSAGPVSPVPVARPVEALEEPMVAAEASLALRRMSPADWPTYTARATVMSSTVIPVDSAVIVARRLDLTNQTLLIEPNVSKLYIIAEEIQAARGARIAWRRESLSTPDRGSDPGLDGQSWHGKVLAPHSRNGLRGGDGREGQGGLPGIDGRDAPDVEIWAKTFVGMPNIDLSGQDGGRGGRGQRGGKGGRGGDGENGEYWWLFGKHCWKDPGNGGDGGAGGDGGRGGPGGDGGNSGDITLAVLEETLSALTTTNAFTPEVSAGRGGRAGGGGARGEGGPGGRRGYTEVCDGGRDGARGQPGRVGQEGHTGSEGQDGRMRIMSVTEESWNEQLTRPWLYELMPSKAFPGTRIVIKGSRFADTDRVVIDTRILPASLRADGGLEVVLPTDLGGGDHDIYVRRHDGTESNRLIVRIRPQLSGTPPVVSPASRVTLSGRAFLAGAMVSYGGGLYPATGVSGTRLEFETPGISGPVNNERHIEISVMNPDGLTSNVAHATVPRVLQNGFRIGVHDFKFANDADGRPSWDTFEDTFGALEVYHELLDPLFGHPILTGLFYAFYEHFLKGTANGGLATGFCTSLASLALDRFWQGHNDTFTAVERDEAFRRRMTAVHGRLLSRESLLTMHDQSRRGSANVETVFRAIESDFQSGGTRETAPLLFFIPSGAAWDAGYFDKLSDSHCIVPVRIVYPEGYDGSDVAGVHVYCWDNNHPNDATCRVELRRTGGQIRFDYITGSTTQFRSEDGITLGHQSLGEYYLRDVDMPFSGPLGLTTFVFDFLLSPATMRVSDGLGRITGQLGGQILADIPGSLPGYLLPNAYMLPVGEGLNRHITGSASGSYGYGSIDPDGASVSLSNVVTRSGETDILAVNADYSRVRFVPGRAKSVDLAVGRTVGQHARGLRIENFQATPDADLDVTASPDLSLVRVSNRGPDTQLTIRALGLDVATRAKATLTRSAVPVPAGQDLVVAVTDWPRLSDSTLNTTTVAQ